MDQADLMGRVHGMAPCGIICGDCDIFHAAQDAVAAERLAEGWRAGGLPNAKAEWFRCQGCRGDRTLLWTEDCRIRACCMGERGLASCAECADFPCQPYLEWAGQGEGHAAAFERLRQLR